MEKPTEISRGSETRLPWAWDALCVAMPMNEASDEGLREIVAGVKPATKQGMTWVRDNRGNPTAKFTNVDPCYCEWPDAPWHDRPSSELTVHVRLKSQGTAELAGGAFCNAYDTSPPYMSYGVFGDWTDATKLVGVITVGGIAKYTGSVVGSLPTTEYVSAFLRWRSGESIDLDVYGERGAYFSGVTGGDTGTGTISYNAGEGLRLNASDNINNHYDALYSQVLVWSRRLTDTEMAALVADPFGWYSPRRETVGLSGPYALPFGGGEMRIASMGGGMM